ncbi:MAG: hypothetical protein HGB18_04140 [Candidatus Moranbacteria bacterium]|nr:hypothetical protein [Candidatus Moranbacteria bacterium]
MPTTETGTSLSQIRERLAVALEGIKKMPITPQIAGWAGVGVPHYFGGQELKRIAEGERGYTEGRSYLSNRIAAYREKSETLLRSLGIPAAVQAQAVVLPQSTMTEFLEESGRILIETKEEDRGRVNISAHLYSDAKFKYTNLSGKAVDVITIVFALSIIFTVGYALFVTNAPKTPLGWVSGALLFLVRAVVSIGSGIGVLYLADWALGTRPAQALMNNFVDWLATLWIKRFVRKRDRSEILKQLLRPASSGKNYGTAELVFAPHPDELERTIGMIPEIRVAAKPESVGIIPLNGDISEIDIKHRRPDLMKLVTDSPKLLFYVNTRDGRRNPYCILLGSVGTLSNTDLDALDRVLRPEKLVEKI